MDSQTKTKAVNLEDLQISVREVFNKGFGNSGTCTTAAATPAKEVTLGTIFSLVTGCALLVKFTHGITSENSTLAVTHTVNGSSVTETAKPIYLNGAALEANIIQAGASILLRYNGTQFDIIGGAGSGNEVEIGETAPVGNPKLFVDEDEDPAVAFDVYTRQDTDAMIADTVHVSAQTLSEAQKAQARTNIGAIAAPVFDDWYNEVSDTTGKNPSQEGWYEESEGVYTLTSDTTPQAGKTYYVKADYEVMTI